MITGIVQVKYRNSPVTMYYYVRLQVEKQQVLIQSTQTIKPFESQIDLQRAASKINHGSVRLQDDGMSYLFCDDTNGLVTTLLAELSVQAVG